MSPLLPTGLASGTTVRRNTIDVENLHHPPSSLNPMGQTASSQPSVIAVFDFDGTLTKSDSLFPFLQQVQGPWSFYWQLLRLSPILLAYVLKLIPNWQAKETLLQQCLGGLSETHLRDIGEQFAIQEIPQLLRPEAVQRLHWHQSQHHQTVVISASLEVYLIPWCQMMGVNYVSGTQLVVESGYVTGKILGKNCYGEEKVQRLKQILGDLRPYWIYVYGDSEGDRELLTVANSPYYQQFWED